MVGDEVSLINFIARLFYVFINEIQTLTVSHVPGTQSKCLFVWAIPHGPQLRSLQPKVHLLVLVLLSEKVNLL